MSLFNIFNIAGSGMVAQSIRLNLNSSNLANADSISSNPEDTYRARHPVFAATLQNAMNNEFEGVGVNVLGVIESKAPLREEYQPDHPAANEAGYIYRPNVDVMASMADMLSASRSYQSNVEVINAAKQMLLRTLSLGQ